MQVSELSLEHTPDWAPLLAAAFGRSDADMRHLLTWLHTGFHVIAYGAWLDDHLVAQYACLLRSLYLPETGSIIQVGMSVNMAVHPDYRGRGLIKHLAQPTYEAAYALGASAGVGFSNAEGVKVDRRSTTYGYRVCGQLEPTVALIPFYRRHPPLELTDQISGTLHPELFSPATAIRFIQTSAALDHRYRQHPFRQYQFGIWREGDCILGIVIYRPVQLMGMPAAALLGAYAVDIKALLHRWTASIQDTGIRIVHLLSSPHSVTRQALAEVVPLVRLPRARSPYYLTLKPLDEHMPTSLFNYAEWDCIGGDVL